MMLLTHIVIALASVAFSTYLFARPTHANFRVSYGLVGLTIASGTYLVVLQPAHLVHACTSGLVYIALVLVAIAAAHKKAGVTIDK